MSRSRFILGLRQRWVLSLLLASIAALLPGIASAQTVLRPGDIVITAINSSDPDDFAFAPLVNLAGGTQITFTDNGWQSTGSFRATEGTAVYTAPVTGVPKGTIITRANNSANFVVSAQFLLSTDGDQLIAYQGTATNPTFVYALTTRGSGWTNATSANTSALPTGLQNGVSAVAVAPCNAEMDQPYLREGTVASLRANFSNPSNWHGGNANSARISSFNAVCLSFEDVMATTTERTPGYDTDITRIQEVAFEESAFAAGRFSGTLGLRSNRFAGNNAGCAAPQLRSAVLYLRLDTGPVHNVGLQSNSLTADVNISLAGSAGSNNCPAVLPVPLSSGVSLHINERTPRQVYKVDLTSHLNSTQGNALTYLTIDLNTLTVVPASMRRNVRVIARLEQVLTIPPLTANNKPTVISPASGTTDTYSQLERTFKWSSTCTLIKNYQLQILKRVDNYTGAPTPDEWRDRAVLLETETNATEFTTTLAEGPGTYQWRVRAIGTAEGGIGNPENLGEWSDTPGEITLAAPTAASWTTGLNWIYSRSFSEGGKVSEKMTFANGLLYTRQEQTRLRTANGPLIVNKQTLQDYVGRNALQSLPIPLPNGTGLGYRQNLLQGSAGTYNTSMFDEDAKLYSPDNASVSGNYYSGTAAGAQNLDNSGVASAEGFPFMRTLYTRDGTNRVREQAGAGAILGVKPTGTAAHTVRTSYGSVAQSELNRIFGATDAPLASNTYKVVTQDPNNTSSVTYQTKDGKTIATALYANSGAPSLEPLASARASTYTITEQVNDRLPYNNVGSISSKILIVPAGSTIDLQLTYTLQPNSIQDICGQCKTCDYKVRIVVRDIDNPSATDERFVVERGLVSCGQAQQFAPINSIQLSGGTYVIEKTVVAYNTTTGTTTSPSTTYIAAQLAELRANYEAERSQVPSFWPNFTSLLVAGQATAFYDALEANQTTSIIRDGVKYYQLPFGCAPNNTIIEIPVIPVACGDGNNNCQPGSAGYESFEAYMQRVAPTAYQNFSYWFPGRAQGDIDLMSEAMMRDSYFNGKCDSLWNCWRSVVGSLDAMQQVANTSSTNVQINALQDFLDCINVKKTKAVSAGTGIPAADLYTTFEVDGNNASHMDCLSANGFSSLSAFLAWVPSGPDELKRFNEIYKCIRYNRNPNGTTLPTAGNIGTYTQQQLDIMQDECQRGCEDRRGEFRQAIILDLRNRGVLDDASDCEIEFMVEELVAECKGYCRLTVSGPTDMSVSQEERDKFELAMTGKMNVQVRKVGEACEGDGYRPTPLITGPILQTVKPTQCAYDLVSYLAALCRKAKTIPAFMDPSRTTPLGCLPSGQSGIGENALGVLSYVGPLGLSCNRMFPADYLDRENYWVTVQDARGDVASLSNPSGYSNPQYTPVYDFRVIWATQPATTSSPAFFPNVCFADGDDVPGVPKLLSSSATGTYDYILHFVDTNTGHSVPKNDITNISAPFIDPTTPGPNYQDPNSTDNVFVTLYLTNGTRVKARIQMVDPASGTLKDIQKFLVWKEFNQCEVPDRNFTTCYRWTKPVLDPETPSAYNPQMPSCEAAVAATVLENIRAQQDRWINQQLTDLQNQYVQQCVVPENLHDNLTLSYRLGIHHYTLYYYDRAGNLVKTVPPAGVDLVNQQHKLATTYKYNSLKQLTEQNTPDGGRTLFYYNRVGQLRFSINDKQRREQVYSYTKYDALGRIVDVGESRRNFTTDLSNVLPQIENASFPEDMDLVAVQPNPDLPTVPTHYNRNVTLTIYSAPKTGITYQGKAQRYLTNRVSYVISQADASDRAVYTYYSYDPHGNVEWLGQQIPGLPVKYVSYEYDLISNKVLRVNYQKDQVDQFFHRYEYDDENRLLAAYTSTDGVIWDQDARYDYYAHGPLKRLQLGQDMVQGIDYNYTLQGWLKGINHPNLDKTKDPGADGASSGAAVDAFGMTLGYFQGDYVRTGSFLNATPVGTPPANPDLFEPTQVSQTDDQNLYNGNIATWQTRTRQEVGGTPVQGPQINEMFRYDQLNRLRYSRQYDLNMQQAPLADFATDYTYDANGNLLTLNRRDAVQPIDQLTYNYQTLNGQPTNRLQSVTDGITNVNASAEDIDDQASDNYDYDETGNLIQDKQSNVTSIAWTPYGKISRIQRVNPNAPGDFSRAIVVTYDYDAAGNRVRKVTSTPGTEVRTTYYVRDAQGNMMSVYERVENTSANTNQLRLAEQPIYGYSRLGERKPDLLLAGSGSLPTATTYTRTLGLKQYELNDHLGNVRVVLTDEKQATVTNGIPDLTTFRPTMKGYYNYYAFGMMKPNRYGPGDGTAAGGYRFGYNGKEKDNNGELGLTNYEYGARIYNPAMGRFLSVDPLTKAYPMLTPYQYAGNRPIDGIDVEGLEWKTKHSWNDVISEPSHIEMLGDKYVKGMTYKEAWAASAPGILSQSIGKKIDCADLAIDAVVNFAYKYQLGIRFEDNKAESDPTFDNDNFGFKHKKKGWVSFKAGQWQRLADNIKAYYGAADIFGNKNLTEDIPLENVQPGDIVSWKHPDGEGYHAQTVTQSDEDGYTTIQGNLDRKKGALPARETNYSFFNLKWVRSFIEGETIKGRKWNFKKFDKK